MISNPAKRATSGRKRNTFVLPATSQTRKQGLINGRMSHALLSMASDDRIREATPILKSLYAFLGKDKQDD